MKTVLHGISVMQISKIFVYLPIAIVATIFVYLVLLGFKMRQKR